MYFKKLCIIFCFSVMSTVSVYAKPAEIPAVVLSYATMNEAGLCFPNGCKNPEDLKLEPLQGYWFKKPQDIRFASISKAMRMKPLTVKNALVYDYSVQRNGRKQDIVKGFVREDHKKMWLVLEQAYLDSRTEISGQKDIQLLGYGTHPQAKDYLFAFVRYVDQSGDSKRRIFVFTLEENRLKRTFSFAVKHKEIYRVIETSFNKGGEHFKVYEYNKKNGKTIKQIEDPYHDS